MKLSQEAVDEFKKIYFEEYDENLTYEKAHEKALRFLLLFKAIYEPTPKEYKQEI